MQVRVEVIGPVRVLCGEDQTVLRSNAKIVAYLALMGGTPVTRQTLWADLYPEEIASVAANRLRVALSGLRQQVGPALCEDPRGLWLNPDLCTTDLHEVEEALAHSEDHVEDEHERQELLALIDKLDLDWGLAPEEAWTSALRVRWVKTVESAAIRIARLTLDTDPPTALWAAERVLRDSPRHPRAWEFRLRAMARLGQSDQALREFRLAERDTGFQDNALAEAVLELKQPEERRDPLDIGGQLFDLLIEHSKPLAREFLASPPILPLSGQKPREILAVLQRVLEPEAPGTDAWERCVARAVGLHAWLNQVDETVSLGQMLLGKSQNPILHRAIWNAISAVLSYRCDWKGAHEAIDQAILIAKDLPDPVERLSGLGNKATYLWMEGRFQESEVLHNQVVEDLWKVDTPRARFDIAVNYGNRVWIPLYQGDWDRANDWIQEAVRMREELAPGLPPLLLGPAEILAKAFCGPSSPLARPLHERLREVFATRSIRFQLIATELAAGVAYAVGQGDLAKAAWLKVREWREEHQFPLGPAESGLWDLLMDRFPGRPRKSLEKGVTPGSLAKILVRAVRSAESSSG